MLKGKVINNKKVLVICLISFIAILLTVLFVKLNILNNKNAVATMGPIDIYTEENLENNDNEIVNDDKNNNNEKNTIDDIKITEEEKQNIENKENKVNSSSPYYIKVNYGANTVTIYTKDEYGNYTKPFKAMVCSTGTYTPKSGTYKIQSRWEWLGLFGNVYGHYVTQIVGDILFHSVPYTAMSPNSLEYWEYDKLGTTASLGCVRLKVCDSKWIYDNIPRGTLVEFYSDSNPGPLGKPSFTKISDNITCRNWDPTDSDSANPWKTYNNESPKKEDPIKEPEEPPKEDSKPEDDNKVDIYGS